MAGTRIVGLKETLRALQRLGVSSEDLKQAMQRVSAKAVSDAKSLVPVRTGALKASIRPNKAKNKAVVRAGSARLNYASFVEYGSVHNEAVAMVRESIAMNQRYAAQQIELEIDSLASRYGLNK